MMRRWRVTARHGTASKAPVVNARQMRASGIGVGHITLRLWIINNRVVMGWQLETPTRADWGGKD